MATASVLGGTWPEAPQILATLAGLPHHWRNSAAASLFLETEGMLRVWAAPVPKLALVPLTNGMHAQSRLAPPLSAPISERAHAPRINMAEWPAAKLATTSVLKMLAVATPSANSERQNSMADFVPGSLTFIE